MNNIIKILLVTFSISFPSTVFGGIGDVYYCSEKNFVVIENFKVTEHRLDKFKFKLTDSGLKFGYEENFFQGVVLEDKKFLSEEQFEYGTKLGSNRFIYHDGIFNYSQITSKIVIGISGTCEKF